MQDIFVKFYSFLVLTVWYLSVNSSFARRSARILIKWDRPGFIFAFSTWTTLLRSCHRWIAFAESTSPATLYKKSHSSFFPRWCWYPSVSVIRRKGFLQLDVFQNKRLPLPLPSLRWKSLSSCCQTLGRDLNMEAPACEANCEFGSTCVRGKLFKQKYSVSFPNLDQRLTLSWFKDWKVVLSETNSLFLKKSSKPIAWTLSHLFYQFFHCFLNNGTPANLSATSEFKFLSAKVQGHSGHQLHIARLSSLSL